METFDEELARLLFDCSMQKQHALEQAYKKVSPYLATVARNIVGCDALAKEVLQDSFIQIWENAASYCTSKGRPLTWMSTIVRNRAIDKLKLEKKHRRSTAYESEWYDVDCLPSTSQPESEMSQAQSIYLLYRGLNALTPNEQRSIKLAYLDGYSGKELAEVLEVNVNTVKSWLHRGSRNLKQYLKPQFEIIDWYD